MNIILRAVTIEDAKTIFLWRNDKLVRKYFFDSGEVSWDTHTKWLEQKLSSPLCHLLLAHLDRTPIGVIRFDIKKNIAELSIYLSPTYINKGLGKKVISTGLYWAKENLPEIECIHAIILSENIASQKAFERSGFSKKYCVYEFSIASMD